MSAHGCDEKNCSATELWSTAGVSCSEYNGKARRTDGSDRSSADHNSPTEEASMATLDRTIPTTHTQPKRQRGDGRIFLRGSKLWCAFSVAGVEHRESTNTNDPIKAEKYLRARLKHVHAHELDPIKPFITQRDRKRDIHELLDALNSDFVLRGKDSPQNLSNIKRAKADFGHIRALQLTPEAVDEYIVARLAEGSAPASINRVLQLVKQSYKLADFPAPRIRRLSEKGNVRQGFFLEAEFRRVLLHLPPYLYDFCLFAYLVGWRKSEVASLEWTQVEGNVIRLKGVDSKNGEGRLIVCTGELLGILERRRSGRAVETPDGVVLATFVFHKDGRPIGDFRKAWAAACSKAGVQRLFHDFRRTAVRNMVRAGVPEKVAMQISGHKTRSIFDRYNIVNESDIREAIESTQQYLRSARENVVEMSVAASK
jgi:integrase